MRNISLLKKLGLSTPEINVYQAILESGHAEIKDVSVTSHVPLNRIYDTTKKLYDKGFIKRTNKRPVRYIAINPETAIKQKLTEKREKDEEANEQLMALAGQLLEEWEPQANSKKSEIFTYTVDNASAIVSECIDMLDGNTKNIVISMNTFYDHIRQSKILDKIKSKTTIQILSEKSISSENKNIKVKNPKKIDTQYIIFDGEKMILILEPQPKSFRGVFIKDENIANIFKNKFDESWKLI